MGEANREEKNPTKPVKKRLTKLTVKNVTKALDGSAGILSVAAKKLDCSRSWLHEFIHKHPKLINKRAEEKERLVDLAESQLVNKVKEGNWDAVKYTLKTQGKDRGYAETNSDQFSAFAGVNVTIEKPDDIKVKVVEQKPNNGNSKS